MPSSTSSSQQDVFDVCSHQSTASARDARKQGMLTQVSDPCELRSLLPLRTLNLEVFPGANQDP